jgi:putative membrane protein
MNKDLILREYLAIERTRLANETTFLAYIRTGLYFIVAGSTLGQVIHTPFWEIAGTPLMITGILIMIAGLLRYRFVKKAINKSKQNVGQSTEEFIKYARGNFTE